MNLFEHVEQNVPDYEHTYYKVTGGVAYTEDNFVIHALFVDRIPRRATFRMVLNYFMQYGHVSNIRLASVGNPEYPKVAYVNFESAVEAARVLYFYHTSHIAKSEAMFRVRACNSWHQPGCQSTKQISQDSFNQNVQPDRDCILVLNDDCLDYVLRRLPIKCQISFARSSPRICETYLMTSKSLHRSVDLNQFIGLTQWQIRDFLEYVGDCIKHIQGELPELNYYGIVKFITTYCPNVEYLSLNLKILLWKSDVFLNLFRNMTKLRTLKFSEQIELSGKHLSMLPPTIECLHIRNCIRIKDAHIISLCQSLKNLTELDIGDEFLISQHIAENMALYFPNLKSINIRIESTDFGLVAKLGKLKSLSLNFAIGYNNRLLKIYNDLVNYKSTVLEVLRIGPSDCVTDRIAEYISQLKALRTLVCTDNAHLTGNGLMYLSELKNLETIDLSQCHNITSEPICEIVCKCQKLKKMKLEGCHMLTENVIFRLIQMMRNQIRWNKFMRTEPLLLTVSSLNFDEDILNDPDYIEAANLIVVEIVD